MLLKFLAILFGKMLIFFIQKLRMGFAGTWPGEIALRIDKNFLKEIAREVKKGIIVVSGTNGKTTTTKIIREILNQDGVIHNASGANLLNGIASAFVAKTSLFGKLCTNWAVFEVDEGSLPLLLSQIKPKIVILLNLFRDQLDRYGELNMIAKKWKEAIVQLPSETIFVLNADDPQIALLSDKIKGRTIYFGLDDKNILKKQSEDATDSLFCPRCGKKLSYEGFYFSHLGKWRCLKCRKERPSISLSSWENYPLEGVYNRYNILASVLAARALRIDEKRIRKAISDFKPAFGRQEEIKIDGKSVKILLSKNPAGFNESIRTVLEIIKKKKIEPAILFVLNDRIPDGQDVSWIWDVDFENLVNEVKNIIVSGDRCYDMGLRFKYSSSSKFQIEESLKKAIDLVLKKTAVGEIVYVLPTYSAMLEVRQILTAKRL